jgi:hypothetical protein
MPGLNERVMRKAFHIIVFTKPVSFTFLFGWATALLPPPPRNLGTPQTP